MIFNFVGSEMAETDGGVADLLAWDNIECCQFKIFYLFKALFGLWIELMFAHWNF